MERPQAQSWLEEATEFPEASNWSSETVALLAEAYLDLLDKFERVTTCR